MPTDEDYRQLLEFRTRLREFVQWSRSEAEARGITHTQHQLLLAIRGTTNPVGPTIGEVADLLFVKHHTAGELVDRTQRRGLVERVRDADDNRRVRLRLTKEGHELLAQLTDVHLQEVRELARLFPFVDA